MFGQKLTNWICVVERPDAIDPPEALDDPNRVPVDVVVHQKIAVLKVLTFGDAIRGDEKIDFTFCCHISGAFFGARRKCTQKAAHVAAHTGQRGAVCAGAGHHGSV